MALENPITSDDLTIDFAALLDMSVSNRVQAAASDNTFAQALMASLTPIQMAKAFPDYYRQELPDISNFILANRYLDENGKDAFDQQGGGDPGKDTAIYDGEKAIPEGQKPIGMPDVSIEDMQAELLKKGIDVNNIYDLISKGLSADDPQVQFLKDEPADKLAKMGIEQVKTDDGKVMLRKAPEMSDQEISSKISGKFVAKEDATEQQKAIVREANRLGVDPKDLATIMSYESAGSFDPNRTGPVDKRAGASGAVAKGAQPNMLGLIQFGTFEQLDYGIKPGMSFDEQMVKVGDYLEKKGFKKWLAEHEDATDEQKRIALYSTVNAGGPDESNWSKRDSWMGGAPGTVADKVGVMFQEGKPGITHRGNAVQLMGDSYSRIDGNATPEQIAKFKEDKQRLEKEAFTKEKFNEASPTSIQVSQGDLENVDEQQQKVAGVRKGAIKTELKKSLSYAADQAGDDQYKVVIAVTSGGQRMEGAEGATGSHRHDEGGAADFNAYLVNRETGERTVLDPRKKEHIPYLTKLTTEFSRVHPDAGVGALYMDDPTKIHFGGDDVSEHGGRARGPLAYSGPDWFKQAHAEGVNLRQEDIKNKNNVLLQWEQKKQETLTASAPVEETPGAEAPRVFVGDSIAQGLKDAAGGEGHTIVSRKPHQVLADMENLGQEYFKGKNVVLSTGLSNNTQDIESVRKQMEFLKNAGANVQVAGMSNSREDLAPGNQQLQQLSSEYGYSFMGGFDAGEDEIHPTSYSKYATEAAESIRAAEADGHDHSHDGVEDHVEATPTAETPAPIQTAEADNHDGHDHDHNHDGVEDHVEATPTAETPAPIQTTEADQQEVETVQITKTKKSGAESLPESHPFSMNSKKKKRIIEAQNAKTETTTTETPEPIVYDGRRELFQTAEAVVGEQPAIAKLSKPSVIPPGTNKHQADMGNATSGGAFPSAEEITEAPAPVQVAEATPTVVAPAPIQTAEATPTVAAKLSKPSVIPPGTNKHQADMGNATSGGAFPSLAPTAETPAPIQTAEAPAPVKSAEAAPAPVQVAEAISVPTAGTEEVRTFRTGGSPDVQDDENLSVFDEDGSLKWKMNSGEGIYVKPKDTEYADDKINELSGRVDEIDQRSDTPEKNQPKAAPDKSHGRPEKNWQQNASSVTYSIGSQGRAFKRTKFQNEGFHFNRSAPNSTSS
jgi:hypothetical protein